MNIGIFGAGSFGEKHIRVIQTIEEFKIIGFYDPNKQQAEIIHKTLGIPYYSNPDSLIKKCDIIDIVSSTNTHAQLIHLALKHKKHIFVEKPICCTKLEIDHLLELEKHNKHTIQVGHIERYNPAMIKTKNIIKNVRKIESKRYGMRNNRNKKTSITLDLMIHDIDIAIHIANSKIKNITASGKDFQEGFYNCVSCEINFQNGITAELIATRSHNIKAQRKTTIYCSHKTIFIDLLNRNVTETQNNKNTIWECDKELNMLEQEFLDLKDNIQNNKKPLIGLKDACTSTEIALEIEELIKSS